MEKMTFSNVIIALNCEANAFPKHHRAFFSVVFNGLITAGACLQSSTGQVELLNVKMSLQTDTALHHYNSVPFFLIVWKGAPAPTPPGGHQLQH